MINNNIKRNNTQFMSDKPICHKKEFEEIISLFRDSIQSELQNNQDELIQEFENKLLENLQVLPNIEEKQVNKNTEKEIKSLQAEAVKIQANLHIYHTNFIENVRSQIEHDLNSNLPHIEQFDEEEDYTNDPVLKSNLELIDKTIIDLQQKEIELKSAMDDSLEKYSEFAKHISSSLNKT